jgi:hypothetical protein
MDHDSYWYGYLMARHNISLILAVVLIGMALISTVTGVCLVKYQGIVMRATDPKTFWQNVAMYYLLGILFLGLYLYTAN